MSKSQNLTYPDALDLLGYEWVARLLQYTDAPTITDSTWTEATGELDITDNGIQGTVTSFLYTGGVPGTVYEVFNKVTLSNGLKPPAPPIRIHVL